MNLSQITPHVMAIKAPLPLRSLQAWLCWRFEHHPGEPKARKMPYYANGSRRFGANGNPKDRAQLVTFDAALKSSAKRGFDGVGLALLDDFGVTALDFDNCVDPSGNLDPSVEAMLVGTYAEYSPSHKGVRAFVLGNLGNKKSPSTPAQYGFETFHSKGYVTFTGNALEMTELTGSDNTIAEPSPEVMALYLSRFNALPSERGDYNADSEQKVGLTQEQLEKCLYVLPHDLGYDDWLQVGMAVHHETDGEGFEAWEAWNMCSPKHVSREYDEARWASFGRYDGASITARSLVRRANTLGADIPIDIAKPSDFEAFTEPPAPPEGYFHIRPVADFLQNVKPVSWLIKGFLPKATLGVLYGESGSGKSFVAFDICAALGRNVPWNNHRQPAAPARVLYVIAEGVGGFHHRIRAYCHQAGIVPLDLNIDVISDVTPNLTDSASVTNLIKDIQARHGYDLIVMDTFAQVTPGANENSGEDMGRALGYCRKISQSIGAMVMLIHHSGKDASKGARGWSGTHAAADVVYEITRFDNERCLEVVKQKDGMDGAQFGFTLNNVLLGTDEDGDDIASCVVTYCDAKVLKKQGKKTPKLGEVETIVLGSIHGMGDNPGGEVPYVELIDSASANLTYDPLKKDQRKARVRQALQNLITKGIIEMVEQENGTFLKTVEFADT